MNKKIYTEKERAQMLWTTYKRRLKGSNPFDDLQGFAGFEQFVHSYYGQPCHYCGDILTPQIISLDHKDPLNRGGSSHPGNLDCVCKRCNRRKGELTEGEYQRLLVFLADYPEMKAILLRRLGMATFLYRRPVKG